MMKQTLAILIAGVMLIAIHTACDTKAQNYKADKTMMSDYVNPFIGTGLHGHTFPGATYPNGMVQLSPDTRYKAWDACAGYHYTDTSITGFSHTHLSGTGIGDYGDISFMPYTGKAQLQKGSAEIIDDGYRSRFSHDNETASPGYYAVFLEDYKIKAELTTTPRAGFHRYTFPKAEEAGIIIDLTATIQEHKNPNHMIKVLNSREIIGLKQTKGWATNHYVYFHAIFNKDFEYQIYANDKPLKGQSEFEGQDAKIVLKFKTDENEQVLAKVGISSVDTNGAGKNVTDEIPDWNFDAVQQEAARVWEKRLSAIAIEGGTEAQKKVFYTSMYHAAIPPMLFSDVDGRYRTIDQKIATSKEPVYTVFSLWDTYRAYHPLMTIIKPSLNEAFIRTLLKKYDEGGILPKWELAGNYTGTMIGYHAASVIVDAYMKGDTDFDVNKAYKAVLEASNYDDKRDVFYTSDKVMKQLLPKGKLYNQRYGYIPSDLENESVSKALEYAYNDWGIAQMAKKMGENDTYNEYMERAKRYKKYYDSESGFMRGKLKNGKWREPFRPKHSRHRKDDYCEGNAYQWTWFVPHDVPGLIELKGGYDNFERDLDDLFTTSSEIEGEHVSSDISGMVGQYAHGNEPSHHIAYLYNYIGQGYKTQAIVDKLLNNYYAPTPEGICGNEDAGQMSSWYILSSMGFYPVSPGDNRYAIGRPLFDKVTIPLENGNTFTVLAKNNSLENKYVKSVSLDGTELKELFINHADIMAGKTLELEMSAEPVNAIR